MPVAMLLLGSASAKADVLGTFAVSSNYLWRGVTQTDDSPAVSLELAYHRRQGGYLGMWTSNTDYGDAPAYEIDLYLGHQFDLKRYNADMALRHYYFPKGGKYRYDFERATWDTGDSDSFTEFQLGLSRGRWRAGYAYSPDYLASDHPGHYLEINYLQPLHNGVSLALHFGAQTSDAIDDSPENRVGDFRATLLWQRFSLSVSNLTDNVDGRQSDEIRYVFAWRTVFGDDS